MWRDLANNQISKQKEQNKNTPLRPHSKLLGRRGGRGSDRGGGRWDYDDDEEEGEYETSLSRTVSILVAHFASRPGGLSPWQLCNAAWSIARHVDSFPPSA